MNYTNFKEEMTNIARISGKVVSEMESSHQIEGENFFEFKVEVVRLSSVVDVIPVTISERTLMKSEIKVGDFVALEGEYRSYNKLFGEKSKLILHFFAKTISLLEKEGYVNEIKLIGFVCKEPVYRKTPFEREICDVLLAVNRTNYHKSDYIPCILWGRNARFMASQSTGCKVEVTGRIQSREYKKEREEGQFEIMTAYEVSCQTISVIGNITNLKLDKSELNQEVVNN